MRLGQHAALAQSVERLPRNEKVDSSILSSGSLTHSGALMLCFICVYTLDWLYPETTRASGGMVDAQDLGSCVLRRVGSSPISRTKF